MFVGSYDYNLHCVDAQTGKMKEAVTTAEESVKIAKEKDPKANTSALEKMIADWKSKM